MTSESPLSGIQLLSGSTKRTANPLHYELYLILQGHSALVSGNQRFVLKTQDLFLSKPYENAALYPSEGSILLAVSLRPSSVSPDIISRPDMPADGRHRLHCNSAADPSRDYGNLRSIISTLAYVHFQENGETSLREISLSYALLDCLAREYTMMGEQRSSGEESAGRLEMFYAWLEDNYRKNISLNDAAGYLYIHPNYLLRWLRRQTGKTFLECLNEVRLGHALLELVETDHLLTTVAANNGMAGTGVLNRLVRDRFGCSASEYRDRNRSSQKEQDPDDSPARTLAMSLLKNQVSSHVIAFMDDLSPAGKRVSLDLRQLADGVPMKHTWRRIINLGSIPNLTKPDIRENLEYAKQTIGFRYGRIENVMSDNTIPRIGRQQGYNFARFDEGIRLLLDTGYTPYLELSWHREFLFVSDRIIYAARISLGDEALKEDYHHKLSALIRHAVNTFGLAEVDRWVFEVPFMTDEYLVPVEEPAEFGRRLRETWMELKGIVPNALVGGGSLNCMLGVSKIREILSHMADDVFSPDFFSISCFPFEKSNDSSAGFSGSADRNHLLNRVSEIRDLLQSESFYPKKLFLSSWGPDFRSGNYLNDSCYQAAYAVKNSIDMSGIVNAAGFQRLTDAGNEYLDATKILFGGTGLISLTKFHKPAYGAFQMMSQLYRNIIYREDGLIVTKGPLDSYRIIMCNYIHPNERFLLFPAAHFEPWDTYSFFDERPLNVSLSFTGMSPGIYKITNVIINREHGSILDEWQRYGVEEHLGAADWDYLSSTMHPLQAAALNECEKGGMELEYILQPHEVRLIDIVRKL